MTISTTNRYKHDFVTDLTRDLPRTVWQPLRSFPVAPHPRDADMLAYAAIPSAQKVASRQP